MSAQVKGEPGGNLQPAARADASAGRASSNRPATGPAQAGPAPAGPVTTAPDAGPPSRVLPQHKLRRTRIGGIWLASALFAVVLLLLLIFILENGNKVEISYFGAHGHMPLGVALLLAAVLGILLVVIPGTARIVQLRITARRHRRADATATATPVSTLADGADMPPTA